MQVIAPSDLSKITARGVGVTSYRLATGTKVLVHSFVKPQPPVAVTAAPDKLTDPEKTEIQTLKP